MSVVATLVVPFGSSAVAANGSLIAEWDDSKNLDADGNVKTTWLPGEYRDLLVHHDNSVIVHAVKATGGTFGSPSDENLSRSELVGFPFAGKPQALQYLPSDKLVYDWKGNVGRDTSNVGKEVTIGSGDFPCLAMITYPVDFVRYRLQTKKMELAADETFPLRIYVYYEEVKSDESND